MKNSKNIKSKSFKRRSRHQTQPGNLFFLWNYFKIFKVDKLEEFNGGAAGHAEGFFMTSDGHLLKKIDARLGLTLAFTGKQ